MYIYHGKQKHPPAPAKAPPHGVLREIHPKNTIFVIAAALLLCGVLFCGAAAADTTHTHDGITWTEWTSTDLLPDENPGDEKTGYYLKADVTLTRTHVVLRTLNLCLNGLEQQLSSSDSEESKIS